MKKFVLTLMILLMPCYGWGGVDFDGTDDLMTVSALYSVGADQTMSAYVFLRPDALPVLGDTYIHTIYTSDLSGSADGIEVRLGLDGTNGNKDKFYCHIVEDNPATRRAASSTLVISVGTWYSVFCYSDGTNTNIKVCDHSSGNCTTTVGDAWGANNILAPTGTHNFANRSGGRFWDGTVSEFAIFDDTLSANEMTLLFNSNIKRMPCQLDNILMYNSFDSCGDGDSCNGTVFIPPCVSAITLTGDDGANNTGLTGVAEEVLTYP